MSNPEIIVFTGAMFSSKTSKLLMTLERFKYQHKNIIVFKPSIDDRYGLTDVVSHSGWKTSATVIETGADIVKILATQAHPPDVIAVDELFMIDGVSDVLIWLYRSLGLTIVVSTLDLSATGKPFIEVEKLLPWATRIEKCSAVCTVCGTDAPYTYKKDENTDEIHVGGSETYEPRCFSHHLIVNNVQK